MYKLVPCLVILSTLLMYFSNPMLAKADLGDASQGTVGGADGGYTDGSGPSYGGGDYSNPGTEGSSTVGGGYSDPGGDTSNNFSLFVDNFIQDFNNQNYNGGSGLLGPLSNRTQDLDSGITNSYDVTDPGSGGLNPTASAPVLNATSSCVGFQPVVDLTWSNSNPTVADGGWLGSWFVLKSGVSGVYTVKWYTELYMRDWGVTPNTAYFYEVLGTDANAAGSYWNRTPLSNIMAIYTPDCSVKGYVYNDLDSTSSITAGDQGVPGEIVTVVRAAYELSPAWEEVTSTDENGNPTGFIQHPAVIFPATVMGTGSTDATGYYSIYNVPIGSYTVHHTREPLWSGWSRTTPNDVPLSLSTSPIVSFGLLGPPLATPPPVVPLPSPSPVVVAPPPTVTLWLNGQQSGQLPLSVYKDDPVTLTWQATDAVTCTASAQPSQSYWTGDKNPVTGSQVVDTVIPGTYLFSLNCVNPTRTVFTSIQLNVKQSFPPYLQTTGGDVHSNKNISVPNQ